MQTAPRRARVALVNDYEIVVRGLAQMLAPFGDRIEVVELDARDRVHSEVDVALYDTFAQPEPDDEDVSRLVANPLNRNVAVFTWKMSNDLIDAAMARGATGYLPKSLRAGDLVEGLLQIAAGGVCVYPPRSHVPIGPGITWPGQELGLSHREAEILALITRGKSNAEIAVLVHLSPNTVKTHIRSLYAKIGARNRVDAVLWGSSHDFAQEHRHSHVKGGRWSSP